MNKSIKTRKSLKTLLILTTLALTLGTLGGCTDGYNKKPDNKLKPSPCACNQFVFDSNALG